MRQRRASYSEAAKLLGEDGPLLKALDRIAVITFIGSTISGISDLLGLFDPKADIVRHIQQIRNDIREKISLAKFQDDRVARLTAAHSIVALGAYFDAVEFLKVAPSIKKFKLSEREQAYIAGNEEAFRRVARLSEMLLEAKIPCPSPTLPFESALIELKSYYDQLSRRFMDFLRGLSLVDSGDARNFERIICGEAPAIAIRRYESDYLKLASQFTEFYIWANLNDNKATRTYMKRANTEVARRLQHISDEITSLRSGLGAIEGILRRISPGSASYAKSSLATKNRAELDWPIVERGSLPVDSGIQFPRVFEGYINPGCRVVESTGEGGQQRFGEEEWWKRRVKVSDVQVPISALLDQDSAPIVVLGQPGAGKSLLTRVVTARLSESGYLCVRVELRHVSRDASVQRQIEESLLRETGESTTWPDLVRAHADAPRVVLLDGLDELIQSSQVSRSDYLESVQDFQHREASLNRPVTVIVTSRTVVADRTRFPSGSIVIRLDPFTDDHVELWLNAWNKANKKLFASTGVEPLTAARALRHRDLAQQPLLLLMLAIYDSDENALQKATHGLTKATLYNQILSRFAFREIASRDSGKGLADVEIARAVEYELHRLALVAIAMLNRGRQWISLEELESDFSILLQTEASSKGTHGFQSSLSEAEVAIGRFFFIYESKSIGDRSHRTFEFLHPTFGEFLAARYIFNVLTALDGQRCHLESNVLASRPALDDGLLFSLVSYSSLATRGPVMGFIKALLGKYDTATRSSIKVTILKVLAGAEDLSGVRSFSDYRPVSRSAVHKMATYASNLALLAVASSYGPTFVSEFFSERVDEGRDVIFKWGSTIEFWRSQLRLSNEWQSFIDFLSMQRVARANGKRDIILSTGLPSRDSYGFPSDLDDGYDLRWELNDGYDWYRTLNYNGITIDWRGELTQLNPLGSEALSILTTSAKPVLHFAPSLLEACVLSDGVRIKSGLNVFLSLLLAPRKFDSLELAQAYEEMLTVLDGMRSTRELMPVLQAVLDRMVHDRHYLDIGFFEDWILSLISTGISERDSRDVEVVVERLFVGRDDVRAARIRNIIADKTRFELENTGQSDGGNGDES